MIEQILTDGETMSLIVTPILILLARVVDVSLQTLRIIFSSKGRNILAPIIGFFEVFVWIVAMGQIFKNIDNIFAYLAYSTGFALGNFLGIKIEKKLAIGYSNIQIYVVDNEKELIDALDNQNTKLTIQKAESSSGEVKILGVVIPRKKQIQVEKIINQISPASYVSVSDIQSTSRNFFPIQSNSLLLRKRARISKPEIY